MSMVAAQMLTLQGMPEPADLRRTEVDGQTVITVGARVIACNDTGDLGMRNFTVLTLTGALRFSGVRVGEVMGLTRSIDTQTVIDLVLLRHVRNRSRWG